MAVQDIQGSIKVPVLLPYRYEQLGNANGTLFTAQGTVTEYVMPVGGSIIGYGANLDGTLTTGTLTFAPTINGTASSATFAAGTLVLQHAYQTTQSDSANLTFNAGDTVGLMWTKAGSVTPTTRNMVGELVVLLNRYYY